MKLKRIFSIIILAVVTLSAHGSLSIQMAAPQSTGSKVIVKLTMKNTYKQKVESARAVVFLLDDQGKMVGQRTEWVIGGTKDKPALVPQASTVYNMVISTDKPFKNASVIFSRIILEDGTVIEAGKGFEIEK